jgi:hypothetical protein
MGEGNSEFRTNTLKKLIHRGWGAGGRGFFPWRRYNCQLGYCYGPEVFNTGNAFFFLEKETYWGCLG